MQYFPTAFTQLFFAWKLYNYALEGQISRDALDITLTFQSDDHKMILVLPDRIFENDDDFILAFENNLSIAFGAAAITLDRSREEAGHRLPNSIETEAEHCIALVYLIRCAFAHDIAEPRWKIKDRFQRLYSFGGLNFDLTKLDGQKFDYLQIGGPERLIAIKDFVVSHLLIGGHL